jgi:pyruvate,water dikinase
MTDNYRYIGWFEELGSADVPLVGGKNASLGEMIGAMKEQGIRVPGGFATTSDAYREFLDANALSEKIEAHLAELARGEKPLSDVGKTIRDLFLQSSFPAEVEGEIRRAYRDLCRRHGSEKTDVAVRSSATAEDLPDASFAGQQETFLNVSGEEELLDACRKCYASLFTDRAISYRRRSPSRSACRKWYAPTWRAPGSCFP